MNRVARTTFLALQIPLEWYKIYHLFRQNDQPFISQNMRFMEACENRTLTIHRIFCKYIHYQESSFCPERRALSVPNSDSKGNYLVSQILFIKVLRMSEIFSFCVSGVTTVWSVLATFFPVIDFLIR